ncbi:KICSTOR complex protein ITFG2-like isoform X2 [Centruroides sculpturatus]|uniref:KICSTOR complex protein ITFG2-like isoform X2 n=2 Tax=Centruroides sculpturatus TaxID=218467 RepID=UPI000C6D2FDA|nr:KICSTOR complex protein ITFG2-like isoform X2 [Centruroides sculpturatus]
MRAVSFVEKVEFNFPGNICKNAIVLGDVDNDDNNELVVGNINGELAVFRYQQPTPWATSHDLGMITTTVVGDILNEGKNFLVTISNEGWCHIFDVKKDMTMSEERRNLISFHTQRLPANTKTAVIADIDGDGSMELILGLTDRVLRTYRWARIPQSSNTIEEPLGKLVGLHKWEFATQIGSISLNPVVEGCPDVIVAQPGGAYIRLDCTFPENEEISEDEKVTLVSKLTPEHHPLALSRIRNSNVSTEIVGGIKGIRENHVTDNLIAVATLDGTLMLVDGDNILWSIQVDHQLFALTKLDMTGDGLDEVVVCAWDGQTYFVNQEQQSVRYQFEEPVCAFTAGYFSLRPGCKVTCLVYATFRDHIYLYYNVKLQTIQTQKFLDVMAQNPTVSSLISKHGLEDNTVLREFYHWLLYGFPNSPADVHLANSPAKSKDEKS